MSSNLITYQLLLTTKYLKSQILKFHSSKEISAGCVVHKTTVHKSWTQER